MLKDKKIYLAGHKGLVGSAIERNLIESGATNIVTRGSKELDLRCQADVNDFFEKERPEIVFLAAAKVGGILANSTYTAEFIYDNMMIAANVIEASYRHGVKKLLNLGSSCIFPRLVEQPMKEESLLTGSLEPTNEPYAIAKIAAIKLCRYYNEQYGTNYISAMPTNLYGPNDNFDLKTSHVIPALIRKFHMAKLLGEGNYDALADELAEIGGEPPTTNEEIEAELLKLGITAASVTIWGTGEPYREFLYVDDLAEACVFLMDGYDYKDIGEFINIGAGVDAQIKEHARRVSNVVGFKGEIEYDTTKPDGIPRKLLDSSRMKALGWSAKTSFSEGIQRSYDAYLERRGLDRI